MCKQICCLLNGLLHCLCSYVFDGKPPDMKKEELGKRYDIFEHFFLCYLTCLYGICDSKSSLIARVYYYFQILKKRRCN